MGAELNSHNFLSAISFLVNPIDSCSQMALLHYKMGFSFLPSGSNDNKNFVSSQSKKALLVNSFNLGDFWRINGKFAKANTA